MDPWSAPKEDVVAHDLKLIYVPLFRFRVRTDGNKIWTRYGAILDDIERTCRYWVPDGGIVRFPAYHVQKRDKPGAYGETKGGISACYDNRDVYKLTLFAEIWTSGLRTLKIQKFPSLRNHAVYYTGFATNLRFR